MTTLLIFLVVLAVLVLAHEAGHFFAAKWASMRVDEFGFGFPPRLFGVRRGETEYTVNLIPLGGFVKIHGESGEDRGDPRSFASHSLAKRFLVLVAGVCMNVVLAWVLLSVGFMIGLPSALDGADYNPAYVSNVQTQITYVLPGSPAQEAGLKLGDRVLTVDGVVAIEASHARELIGRVDEGMDATLTIERPGDHQARVISLAPRAMEGGRVMIGTELTTVGRVQLPPHLAMAYGAQATIDMTTATARGFWGLITRLVRGEGVGVEVSGPVGIAIMTGEIADLGFVYLLQFAALLSVNLAILNILPFPALDGGRILFLVIEFFRRKPATPAIESAVHGIGFVLLMILVVLVTYKDIVRLF
ncbi:MAG: RIP metalloprotease RseP [Patescibacteria group bacterium]